MNLDLFSDEDRLFQWREDLYPGAVVLRRYAVAQDHALLAACGSILRFARRSKLCPFVRKRHGMPLAIVIEHHRHDMKLAKPTLESLKAERPSLLAIWRQGLYLDKGYDYPQIRQLAVGLGYRPHIRSRGEEAQQRQTERKARRWWWNVRAVG